MAPTTGARLLLEGEGRGRLVLSRGRLAGKILPLAIISDLTSSSLQVAETRGALQDFVQGNTRFGQLQRAMTGISPKTLTVRLRELEEAGILIRKVFPGYPLHVE